jgi:hypothetical protein
VIAGRVVQFDFCRQFGPKITQNQNRKKVRQTFDSSRAAVSGFVKMRESLQTRTFDQTLIAGMLAI